MEHDRSTKFYGGVNVHKNIFQVHYQLKLRRKYGRKKDESRGKNIFHIMWLVYLNSFRTTSVKTTNVLDKFCVLWKKNGKTKHIPIYLMRTHTFQFSKICEIFKIVNNKCAK